MQISKILSGPPGSLWQSPERKLIIRSINSYVLKQSKQITFYVWYSFFCLHAVEFELHIFMIRLSFTNISLSKYIELLQLKKKLGSPIKFAKLPSWHLGVSATKLKLNKEAVCYLVDWLLKNKIKQNDDWNIIRMYFKGSSLFKIKYVYLQSQ